MTQRISKRLRYEVLRRDNYTCRYCGRTPPDVKLEIDHVIPEVLGGSSADPANLVTACSECNSGKSSSSPDAPVVADVSADALRWGLAMRQAADMLLADHAARTREQDQFAEAWNMWGYGPPERKQRLPVPAGWRKTVDNLLAAGLPMPMLLECIDLAMAAKHVDAENTFRYMCGIAWKRVNELREIAAGIIESDPLAADADCDSDYDPDYYAPPVDEVLGPRDARRANQATSPPPGLLDEIRRNLGQLTLWPGYGHSSLSSG